MSQTLRISVEFPRGAYGGADLGMAEDLPTPARLHEAFVAAAAGGPWARAEDRVLVANDEHRRAVVWLEDHEPLGVIAPRTASTAPRARRYRWRASPISLVETGFESHAALDGPVVYVWPPAPGDVVESLATLAAEVTHVGRADSVAIVRVECGPTEDLGARMLTLAARRGPGRVMRVPAPGRFAELARAHREAMRPGRHGTGSLGKQAGDELITGANETATVLRRFAPPSADADWPYSEVWALAIAADQAAAEKVVAVENRVAAAVGIHRALIRTIDATGADVPAFVTGRDRDGPLRGAGHLAVQIAEDDRRGGPVVLLGIPSGVAAADRLLLRDALARPLRAGMRRRGHKNAVWFSAKPPQVRPAVPFWAEASTVMVTETSLVLEAIGGPRRGRWTLEDGVVCSVGYAMRGVLERAGMRWGTGWAFRRELADSLRRDFGVEVRARRAAVPAGRFVHRVDPGALLVAVDAAVDLGTLAPMAGGFLALGRARHLGGGLLRPFGRSWS